MAQVISYNVSVPSSVKGGNPIVVGAGFTTIATLGLDVFLTPNIVRLIANVGITQTGDIGNVTLRVLRDGFPIYSSIQGVQDGAGAESNYNTVLQALDFNVPVGFHVYSLQATSDAGTTTLSPREFDGLAIQTNPS
ncbi:hypothetical protein GE107_15195 [Cohnella sp. CFH 77786]|uniref:hypothetical protein n=1 Tax=Cohnella sp. CFH 77786 TaxID=2662265 RepID=UPI001C6108DD|nr:hypothetical protein [Cohnella sp. CFH 77786]MBW5447402.1 hypothetical protein [Cohnella sp. CFH 77786]